MRPVGPRRRREPSRAWLRPTVSVGVVAVMVAFLAPTVPDATAATTVETYLDDRFGGLYIYVRGGSAPNDIRLKNPTRDAFIISDSQPIETSDCAHLSAHKVRCELLDFPNVDVLGQRGNDELRAGRSLSDTLVLDGGPGDDVVVGGQVFDRIEGKAGDDVLRGREGGDLIEGWGGKDTMSGGAGADELDAADGGRDRRIRCGAGLAIGDDLAVIDRKIDPHPRRCETIKRVG
jgi:Ca2+-binding RTX toxin-like protein